MGFTELLGEQLPFAKQATPDKPYPGLSST